MMELFASNPHCHSYLGYGEKGKIGGKKWRKRRLRDSEFELHSLAHCAPLRPPFSKLFGAKEAVCASFF
jgi:hypothetical protein